MQKLFFVDAITCATAIDKNLNLIDLAKCVIDRIHISDRISNITYQYLTTLNDTIENILFTDRDTCCQPIDLSRFKDIVSDKEIQTNVTRFLTEEDPYQDNLENKKYYDLKHLPEGIIVVVLEEGFLRYLLTSKDVLKAFYLTVLQQEYDANDTLALGDYIDLMIKDSVFDLMRAKLA